MLAPDGEEYITTAQGTISGGTAIIAIEALIAGAAGNQDDETDLSLVSPIENIYSSAELNAAITDGSDEETDAHLLARIQLQERTPPQGGSVPDYLELGGSAVELLCKCRRPMRTSC